MTQTDLRQLAALIARAHATLAPIAADGRRHDGRELPGEPEAVARAIQYVREAGALVTASAPQSDANAGPLS